MKLWFEKAPELLVDLQQSVDNYSPHVTLHKLGNSYLITGNWLVEHNGEVAETYRFKVEIPADYPDSLPLVYETSKKIPRIADRHINSGGDACLFAPCARWENWPIGSSFQTFLNGPVRNFFLSQAVFDLTGKWPFGQLAHGNDGIIEYLVRLFDVPDFKTIKRFAPCLSMPKIYRQYRCPCGSGLRMIKCHGPKFNKMNEHLTAKDKKSIVEALSTYQ